MMDTTSEQMESSLNKSDNIEKYDNTSGYPVEESNEEGFDFDDEDLKELNDNSESKDIILNNNNNNSIFNLNDCKTTELTNSTPHKLELTETINTSLIKSESNDSSFNSIVNDNNVDKSEFGDIHKSVPEKTTAVSTHHNDIKFKRHHSQQDDFGDDDDDDADQQFVNYLGKVNDIAEARLAQRRQARAEAREIRMRELERQQKEQEQNADRVFDMQQSVGVDSIGRSRLAVTAVTNNPIRGNSMSSRRSSEDSLEEEGRSLRDLRHELKDVEDRFRKAMIANAQLDNERSSQSYQIQLLKDKLEEMEESHSQLQREYKDKCRDHDALKRNNDKLKEELKLVQGQLNERDTLIAEQGLVIVLIENENGTDARRALVSVENAHILETVQGSLDVRLKKFAEEKVELQNEVQKLQQQLSDTKSRGRRSGSVNGLEDDDYEDAQREANKIITEYKYKLQKAEQELASLQASLARSETQVIRYKSTAEAAEKAETDLKIERRKLQRENRETMERLEEIETSHNHLLKRLDKLKNAKSALLKEI